MNLHSQNMKGEPMAKVIIELDDDEDLDKLSFLVNKSKILSALYDLDNFYIKLYNGKIYEPNNIVYVKSDGCIATDEDYEKVKKEGKFLSGGEYYVRQEWLEGILEDALGDIRSYLND